MFDRASSCRRTSDFPVFGLHGLTFRLFTNMKSVASAINRPMSKMLVIWVPALPAYPKTNFKPSKATDKSVRHTTSFPGLFHDSGGNRSHQGRGDAHNNFWFVVL